MKPKSFSVLI